MSAPHGTIRRVKLKRPYFRQRAVQFVAAALLALTGIVLAVAGGGLFASSPGKSRSLWQLILDDRATLGFVRLAVLTMSLYVVSSIGALAVGGRWLRSISTTGIEADEALRGL